MIPNFRDENHPSPVRKSYSVNYFKNFDMRKECAKDLRNCIYGYNICQYGGILRNGKGVGEARVEVGGRQYLIGSLSPYGDTIKNISYFRSYKDGTKIEKLIIFGSSGAFYECDLSNPTVLVKIDGILGDEGSEVTFLNYYYTDEDTLIILYSGGMALYNSSGVRIIEGAPKLTSAVMLYDRLFGADDCSVYFSAPLDPTDFSVENGGGKISLMDEGGIIKKLVSLRSELFIFREHAIYSLAVFGTPDDYSIVKSCDIQHQLYPNTICVCIDKIFYVAGNKFYLFNGYTSNEIMRGLSSFGRDFSRSHAICFDGVVHISCLLNTEGELVGEEEDFPSIINDGAIYFSLDGTCKGVFRGSDIVRFYPLLTSTINAVFVVHGNARAHRLGMMNDRGEVYGKPLEKLWRSPSVIMESTRDLTALKRIYMESEYDLDIRIIQGDVEFTSHAYGRDSRPLNFKTIGYGFSYELKANSDIWINGMTFIFDFIRSFS